MYKYFQHLGNSAFRDLLKNDNIGTFAELLYVKSYRE